MTASRSGTRWRSPNISTRSCPTPACCRTTAPRARIAARSRGEMHSGFSNLRSALPMNLKAHHPGLQGLGRRAGRHRPHPRRSGANAWTPTAARSCSATAPCMADAMFAPVVTRFLTYDVKLDSDCAAYCAGDDGDAARCRNGSQAPRPSRTRWSSSTWSSSGRFPQNDIAQSGPCLPVLASADGGAP